MRRTLGLAVLAILLATVLPGSALASENIIKFYERQSGVIVTQGEWAVLLVHSMGQDDELEAQASHTDFLALLERNQIRPLDGWNEGEFLSYGAKAVTMVQALGLEEEMAPDAKEIEYVWLLGSLGFHEGHPAEVVRHSDALQRNINDPIFQEIAGNEFNINISAFAPRVDPE